MDFDSQIRYEVRKNASKVYRAELKRLNALNHLPPKPTDTSVFDNTEFGQRALIENWADAPAAFDRPEAPDAYRIERLEKEEACDLLDIRQRDPD